MTDTRADCARNAFATIFNVGEQARLDLRVLCRRRVGDCVLGTEIRSAAATAFAINAAIRHSNLLCVCWSVCCLRVSSQVCVLQALLVAIGILATWCASLRFCLIVGIVF